ncbi:hypothetical protein AB205_0110500 [Aquarana catesbeiana]|uniref:MADF domain-containing protein n=1 Tax=Aquarana catesbeiana TaxID=8400 RepID=A0A2G9Q6E6_AQUCT|nr:hypothetical protein AB205_0110500 [Aquarana catesbeiana]
MDILNDTDSMAIFIDMFRELPCLWEINHPHYKNQTKRKAALDHVLEIVKQVIPTADITYLRILIGGLRSTYLRERKKVQDSPRSGAAGPTSPPPPGPTPPPATSPTAEPQPGMKRGRKTRK